MNISFGRLIFEFGVQFIIRSFEALKTYVLNIISWTLGLIKFRRWLIPNVKHLYLVYGIAHWIGAPFGYVCFISWFTSCNINLRWVPQNPIEDKSSLPQ